MKVTQEDQDVPDPYVYLRDMDLSKPLVDDGYDAFLADRFREDNNDAQTKL